MTSLQDQLKRIGTADLRNVTEGTRRHKASFLFTSREAADQDLETIYSIALNGVMELAIIDSKFTPFQKTLFSEKMKGYDRVLQTAEENAKLDKSIGAFLYQLSPYFLLKPAGKTLEWLIRRFRVQDFNVESVLACILPYHETKSFVRMVSLLQIQENTSWSFLLPVKKSSIPLDRSMLIKAMKKNRRVLSFVCKTVIDAPVPFQVLYSFFAATLTDFVNAINRVTDDTMVALLPYLIDSLTRRQNPELQIAAYMVVSQLSSREALSQDALLTITNKMILNHNETLFNHCLLTIVHLAQSQHSFQGFTHKAIKRIFNAPAFESCFLEIAQKYATDRFMSLTMSEFCKAVPKSSEKAELLNSLAMEGLLSHENIQLLSSCAIKGYLESPSDEYIDAFRSLLVTLSQRYIEDLDVVLEEQIKSVQDDTNKSKALYDFSAAGFKGTGHEIVQEANTTLYLSLNSPAASTRLLAMKRLISVIKNEDSPLIKSPDIIESSLLGCLDHFNELLAYAVCDIPDHLLKFVPGRKILSSLSQLLQERGAFRKEAIPVFKFLLGDFSKKYPKSSPDIARILSVFVFGAPSKLIKELVKQTKQIHLDKKSILGNLLDHVRDILKSTKEGECDTVISKLFIDKEASNLCKIADRTVIPLAYWTQMIRDGTSPQKIIALLVITQAMKEQFDASNYVFVTNAVLESMTKEEKFAIYQTQLPSNYTANDDKVSNNTLDMLRKIHDLPKSAIANLIQYTFSVTVSSLRPQPTSVDWFNVKDQHYAELLKILFGTFVGGPTLGCFETMLSALVSRHLKEDVFAFLMSIWVDQDYSTAVRARSLQIAASLMSCYVDGDNDLQHIVPCLLASLHDSEQQIRLCATQCLCQLRRFYHRHGLIKKGSDKAQANETTKPVILSVLSASTIYARSDTTIKDIRTQSIANFIEIISSRSHEVTEDPDCILKLVNDFFVASETSKDKQIKTQGTQVLNLLLDHTKASPSIQLQVALLTLLDDIHIHQKLQAVLPLLEAKIKNATLMGLLIRCYLPENAVQFGKTGDKSLSLFLQLSQNHNTLAGGEDEDGWQMSTRRFALKQISPEFFKNAKEMAQRAIFGVLIDIATNAEQHDVHLAKKVLNKICIPVKLYEEFLTSVVTGLNQTVVDVETTTKRARKEKQQSKVDLYELVTILELIESTVIGNDVLLVKRLFDTLAAMINAELRDAPVSLEYISQLIMSSLTRIIRAAEDHKQSLEESALRVDSVVQCIRTTSNPQTHNQALLLMATIASIYPEIVLHNIMTVFTFMGANVLRQDDNYSFQVIHQTLEKIIPPLVESSRRENENQAAITLQIKPIIKVFVDALIHIPKHRRLPLFTVLIRTLGEDEFLYAIISLLLEKYAVRFSKEDESGSLAEFCKAISQQFAAETQINAVYSLLNDLHTLPNDKPQEDKQQEDVAMTTAGTTVFDLSEHSAKDLRRYKVIVLNYIDQLLVSRSFLAKIIEGMNADQDFEEKMQPRYLKTIELLLKILSYFGEYRERYAVSEGAKPGIVKFWRGAIKVVYDVLDRVNGLLSLHTFVDVISHLLKHSDVLVRRKAMNLFNERVTIFEQNISSEEEELLVGMAKEFFAAIENEGRLGCSEEDGAINKQSALLCISTLARFSGNVYPAPFIDGLPVILGSECLQLPNIQVKISSLSCLAVICQATGPRSIPHLPKFMPIIVELLSNNIKGENPSIMLRLAIVGCLETVVTELPHFMSPYISKMLSGLLDSAIYEHDDEDPQMVLVENKVTEVLATMAIKIPPRVLLNPVFACYESAMTQGKKSALAVVSMISDTIHTMSNDVMVSHYKQIFKFFLLGFDIRRQYGDKFNELEIDELERAMINVFLNLVMKLNETLFKPLYLKVVDWATVELANEDEEEQNEDLEKRVLFFYKLLDALFDRLKSIVTPYFGYVIDDVIGRLQQYTSGEAVPNTLWNYIMLALRKSFQYDNDNLWNASKFDKILDPVVDQMMVMGENESPDQYLNRMSTYLVPLLGQMAQTVANDTLWKPMNYKVLMKTREDVPEIRLAALKCLEEFYVRMGEEWLLFLAESISFLAELMEDDDRRVEKLVQQVNSQIELHLGESLDKFFN
ncbi:hypothetical protein BDA99DRAFT_562196 [Phascolomyces articulosus]|uniref:U3 small nucleolar RNA-associated protein 10 n=1 Tax=Phascolomyces articulosus TaxID=60185 RepID=A0AAD5JV27_9FUNG|nr:hypothetical protein BDA99DRAFT_562196 [Phascolomyces articulosus]